MSTQEKVFVFFCGQTPVRRECDHDYSGPGEKIGDFGWTAVCAKCGASAMDEAMWAGPEVAD